MRSFTLFALTLLSGVSTVFAQLSDPSNVGPTTSLSNKKKICNVLNYGAKADGRTDIGPAILSAFNNCAKAGGATIYIPPGNYAQSTWVTLNGGSHYAFQLDGIITRTGTAGGHMIIFSGATDLEIFSSTSKGGVQGAGVYWHSQGKGNYGPRIFRIVKCTNWSIHDLALADSPAFFIVVQEGSNGEMYNLVLHGHEEGGLDGIDISGKNHWVHDIEVSNKDECVTVKSPAHNFLIERIYCNWSGGSAIGSLSTGTDISHIYYRNVYSWQCNQMMMIKSNGGSGSVSSATFENFIGHSNAYSLDIDQYWSGQSAGSTSTGVKLTDITFKNWKGTCANGNQRAPIQVFCSDAAPCTGITIQDFAMWTDVGSSELYKCRSAYGSGGCLKGGSGGAYGATSKTISSPPSGYSAPKMNRDLSSGFALGHSIPIPSLATSYYPGLGLIKPLMNGSGGVSGGGSSSGGDSNPTTAATPPKTTSGSSGGSGGNCSPIYGQCGGIGYTGPTCCSSGTCKVSNDYYSQCL